MSTAPEIISRIRISDVWAALGGSPLRRGRGRAFWRDGDGYNISVSDAKNCWHDFVSDEGGGVLDLVQKVRGGSRADALRLVADVSGVTLDAKALSNDEKRNYAEHRHQAASLAQQCAWWARAYTQELERTKANACGAVCHPRCASPKRVFGRPSRCRCALEILRVVLSKSG